MDSQPHDPNFEPHILAFLCNYCSYLGADSAGKARIPYPPNVQVVRVMCSSRVDPTFVLHSFARGMDGVLICGCHPGDCHFVDGNYKAWGRFILLRKMLDQLGIEQERFRLEWVSASEGSNYAAIVKDMTDQLKTLGPFRPRPLQNLPPSIAVAVEP